MNTDCLVCHGAPADLPKESFDRHEGYSCYRCGVFWVDSQFKDIIDSKPEDLSAEFRLLISSAIRRANDRGLKVKINYANYKPIAELARDASLDASSDQFLLSFAWKFKEGEPCVDWLDAWVARAGPDGLKLVIDDLVSSGDMIGPKDQSLISSFEYKLTDEGWKRAHKLKGQDTFAALFTAISSCSASH